MKIFKKRLSMILVFMLMFTSILNFDSIAKAEEIVPVVENILADTLKAQPGGANKWYATGSFQGWNNSNPETQLKHLVDGFYEYSTVLDAGDYQFKITKNGTWDGFGNKDGKDGGNFSLKLTEKTKVNFYVNEDTNQARINLAGVVDLEQYVPTLGEDKWPRLVGDIQKVFSEGEWKPEEAKQLFVDYNFDGTVYKLQRSIPVGKYEAKVAFGPKWDEAYGSPSGPGGNLALALVDPADVTFSINYAVADKILTHNYVPVDGKTDGLVNASAIKFDSRSITYKRPFGAIKQLSEDLTLRIGTAKGDVQVAKVELINGKGVAKTYDMRKATTVGETDYYDVTIPKTAFSEIGIWGYKFILVDSATKVEYGDDGESGGVGVSAAQGALPYNLTVYANDFKTPDWMKNAVIYQIFPDRFYDGNEDNNRAKVVDGSRGKVIDGKIVPDPLQYFDGGVANDPAADQVWGDWSDYPENPRQSTPELKPYYPNAKTDGVWTNEFYGGDIQGIEQKLDYLKSLGATAIYLNPVSWAASNHKYDATDYKSLDPMFGASVYNVPGDAKSGLDYVKTRVASDRVYQAFAKAARVKGINLIADGVFNHVGDDSIYFDRYEKYPEIGAYEYWKRVWDKVNAGDSQAQAETAVHSDYMAKTNPLTGVKYTLEDFAYTEWFTVENAKTVDGTYKYEGWWGYDSLPVIDAKTPQAGDTQAISGQHEWNNTNYRDNVIGYDLTGKTDAEAEKAMEFANSQRWLWMGARGWRLDVAPDVSTETWQKFRTAVKSTTGRTDVNGDVIEDPVILGEEWGVATHYLLGDQFDSVMNYQFRNALQSYMINGDAKAFNTALEVIRENYPKEAWEAMLNLVDSHDTIRNITKLDNPTWEEENNKIAPEASDAALKLQALTAIFQMGYPGAPTVYYGDEVGVTGTKDPDSRRSFPWERIVEDNGSYSATGKFTDLFSAYQNAGTTRQANLDLFATGDMQTAYAEGDVIAYARKSDTKGGLVVINRGTEAKTIEADVAGFLPNGLTLKDKLYGSITATVVDGKISLTIPAQTGLMMVSTTNIVNIPAVEGLKAVATKGKVALSWTEVAGATSYNVYRTTLEGQNTEIVGNSKTSSYDDTDVINGTRYYYYVTVVKADGESNLGNAVTGLPAFDIASITDPNSVNDVTIGVGKKTEEIKVTVSIPGLTDDVNYNGKEVPNLTSRLVYYKDGTNVENAMDTKLRYKEDTTDGKKVYYATFEPTEVGIYKYFAKLSTNNGDDYTDSNEVTMNAVADTLDTTAPNVSVLSDITVESNMVTLNWTFDGDDAAGFEVYRKARGGDYEKIATLDKTAISFVDYTVSNDTEYSYKVAAYDIAYNRSLSAEKNVTPTLVMVDVTLKLHIPDYTPVTDDIYIAGDLNGWNSSGGKLTVPSGATSREVVEYSFKMMAGKTINYKYTRGTWPTEAFSSHTRNANDTTDYGNYAYSSTDTNMNLTVKNDGGNKMVVEDYVLRWVDMPMNISMPRISNGEDIEFTTDEDHYTLKGKVPYGVSFTINDKDMSTGMNKTGDIDIESLPLTVGLNTIKLHIEPTAETLAQSWYTDKGRAGQATKTITMKITRTEKVVVTPDTAALSLAITAAQTLHDAAVEGTVNGNYAVGSKAILQTAITAAQAVVTNVATTSQADIDAAVTILNSAVTAFRNSKVTIVEPPVVTPPVIVPPVVTPALTSQRIYGVNRIETSIAIAKEQYKETKPDAVVLATANDFADALVGSGLAYKYNAPMLLVNKTVSNSKNVLDYIKANLSTDKNIYILGETGAVSSEISEYLSAQGYKIIRLGGSDRYATNQKIVENLDVAKGTSMVIATGTEFADALSISSIAAKNGFPILLNGKDNLSATTRSYITKLQPATIYVVGGEGALSTNIETQIKALNADIKIIRLGGADRYETSIKIAEHFNLVTNTITVATGIMFPDALTGSLLAARKNSCILLVGNKDVTKQKALMNKQNITNVIVLGGEGAVSAEVLNSLVQK